VLRQSNFRLDKSPFNFQVERAFFAKHGPCQREGCGHRTPIISTPVVATKTLSVDVWADCECSGCHKTFDIERHSARMAPDSPLFVVRDEKPFAVMDGKGMFTCPHCGKVRQDERALADNKSPELGKTKHEKVELTLLIHPKWLEGYISVLQDLHLNLVLLGLELDLISLRVS
jgi:hypothetical protein